MIDLLKAQHAFDEYVGAYDESIPSIHLKKVHTYETMHIMQYLCEVLHLTSQQTDLACLIALLHDIGRFEQWKRYESFADYKTIDHALFSSELLFHQGLIRQFIDEPTYDHLIQISIEQHNKYKVDEGFHDEELLYIHLIRDADKLDNFRVKEEEKIETLLFKTLDEVNHEKISDEVYQQVYDHQLVYSPTRQTSIDMWLSYIAFIFDLHFDESLQYIRDHHWVDRSFDRLQPCDKHTRQQYEILRQRTLNYVG